MADKGALLTKDMVFSDYPWIFLKRNAVKLRYLKFNGVHTNETVNDL